MSKIDYQVLREAAEKATWGDWESYKPRRDQENEDIALTVGKLRVELEAAAEPDDHSEWADMQFLLWDAQRRLRSLPGQVG